MIEDDAAPNESSQKLGLPASARAALKALRSLLGAFAFGRVELAAHRLADKGAEDRRYDDAGKAHGDERHAPID